MFSYEPGRFWLMLQIKSIFIKNDPFLKKSHYQSKKFYISLLTVFLWKQELLISGIVYLSK